MKRMLALLCLTGCAHAPGSANSVLSEAELALVEGCCLKEAQAAGEALGFENLTRSGAQNALAPESPRSMGGQDFQQRLLYARSSGEFYGVSFTSGPLEDQECSQEAALGIYAQMVEAYAHPQGRVQRRFGPDHRPGHRPLDRGKYDRCGYGDTIGRGPLLCHLS